VIIRTPSGWKIHIYCDSIQVSYIENLQKDQDLYVHIKITFKITSCSYVQDLNTIDKRSTFNPSYHRSLVPSALHSHLLRKFPITFIVEVTGKDQTASYSPTGLPRMLAPRFVSDSRIQLPFSSPWREYGRREDRKGKVRREGRRVFAGDSKVEMNCRHQQP